MKNQLVAVVLLLGLATVSIRGQDRNLSGRWAIDEPRTAAALGLTLRPGAPLPPPAPQRFVDLRFTVATNQVILEIVANNDDAVMLKTTYRLDGSATRVSGARPGFAVAHWQGGKFYVDVSDQDTGASVSRTVYYMDGDELVQEVGPRNAGDSPAKYYYRRRM